MGQSVVKITDPFDIRLAVHALSDLGMPPVLDIMTGPQKRMAEQQSRKDTAHPLASVSECRYLPDPVRVQQRTQLFLLICLQFIGFCCVYLHFSPLKHYPGSKCRGSNNNLM